jgi:hypothetical protein
MPIIWGLDLLKLIALVRKVHRIVYKLGQSIFCFVGNINDFQSPTRIKIRDAHNM